jgi:hypothetical protein
MSNSNSSDENTFSMTAISVRTQDIRQVFEIFTKYIRCVNYGFGTLWRFKQNVCESAIMREIQDSFSYYPKNQYPNITSIVNECYYILFGKYKYYDEITFEHQMIIEKEIRILFEELERRNNVNESSRAILLTSVSY